MLAVSSRKREKYPFTCFSMFHDARQASTETRPGQQDHAQADPVEPEVILDVELADPGLPDDQVARRVVDLGAASDADVAAHVSRFCAARSRSETQPEPCCRGSGVDVARVGDQRQPEQGERDDQGRPLDGQLRPLRHQQDDQRPGQRDGPEQAQQQVIAHVVGTTIPGAARGSWFRVGRRRTQDILIHTKTPDEHQDDARRQHEAGSRGAGPSGCPGPSLPRAYTPLLTSLTRPSTAIASNAPSSLLTQHRQAARRR